MNAWLVFLLYGARNPSLFEIDSALLRCHHKLHKLNASALPLAETRATILRKKAEECLVLRQEYTEASPLVNRRAEP